MKRYFTTGVMLMMLSALLLGQAPDKTDAVFKAAMDKEVLEGDLKGAIEQYKKIAAQTKDRAIAAKALLHMAECYQKLGDAESRKLYERIVKEYGDQRETVATAQAHLGDKPAGSGIVARQLWPGDGSAEEATLSPDGRSVVALSVRDIASGRTTRLLPDFTPSSGRYEEWVTLSPDPKQIAYAFCCQNGEYELRISAAEFGTKPRTILHNPEFGYYYVNGWSPDGKSILTTMLSAGNHAQLAWVSISDGKFKSLTSSDWNGIALAHLSPDGRFIAYSAVIKRDSTLSEIRIMESDGSRENVVVAAGDGNAEPIWTRDGSRLLFLSKRSGTSSLWSIPVRDGKADGPAELVRPNMTDVRPLGFTNTGTLIYVQSLGNQNVFVEMLDASTGKAQGSPERAVDTYVGANTAPSWSPDGKSIAYISRRSEPVSDTLSTTLVIRSIDTGQERTLATFRYAQQPSWFPDGQSLLVSARNAQNVTCFYKVELKSGAVQELVNTGKGGAPSHALSADGRTVYLRNPEKGNAIAAYDLPSGRRTDIRTSADQTPRAFAASPNGRKIAYTTQLASTPHLYVMNTDGTETQDLFAGHPQQGVITAIAWMHDSQSIYFAIGDNGTLMGHTSELWRVAVSGGTPEPMGLSASTVGSISLNPNDTRLVFGGGELTRTEYWALDNLDRTWRH